jgi:hypothetical protein
MKINGNITLLVSKERITLEIQDSDANTTFVKIEMTSEQFCAALGRQGYVKCESTKVQGLERVGKIHENKSFEFEIPDDLRYSDEKKRGGLDVICEKAMKAAGLLKEGWISENYYRSQNSFFDNNGKYYARTTIRRYVNKPETE